MFSLSPLQLFNQIVEGNKIVTSNTTFRTTVDDDKLKRYTFEVVKAIRNNDLTKLVEMLEDGHSFDACNNNGETLLHLACRRSNLEIIQFLIEDAKASTNVVDNMGRTLLHDACWRPRPDIEIMNYLVSVISIETFMSNDCRGHSCFDYCRKEDWNKWNTFIQLNANEFQRRAKQLNSSDSTPAHEDDVASVLLSLRGN